MALTPEQVQRALNCAASARRVSGASKAEMDAAIENVMNNASKAGQFVRHRPAGANPGVASTISRGANGNLSIRFTGSSDKRITTYGFSV